MNEEKQLVKEANVYGIYYYICPNCKHNIFKMTSENFCKYCGQKLDWSQTKKNEPTM